MNKHQSQRDLPDTKPQNHINIQNNVIMSNELDAIGRLPEPLAHRAMNLLEKATEHKMQMDKEIIELEKTEQKHRESNSRLSYILQGFGVLTSFVFIVGSLILFAYLVLQDKPLAWLSIIPAIAPIIISAFAIFSNSKKS